MTHKRRRQGIGLGVVVFLALGLICGWMGVGGVENTLTEGTRSALDGQGLTGIDVDYQGRKAILTGNAPAGTDTAALADSLRTSGVRDVDVSRVNVAAPAVAEPTGIVDMTAAVDGDKIVLSGEVLNEGERDEIVSAAEAEFGEANVTDNLTVSNLAPEIEGADGRVAQVAGLMPRLRNNLVDGRATLTGTALTVTGVAASATAIDAITGPAAGLDGIDAAVDLDFEAPAPAPVPTATPEPEPTATPVPEPTATPVPAAAEVIGNLDLSGVQFETGTAVLTAEATAILDNAAIELANFPDVNVRVEGHTDSRGGDEANLALSQARAESVVAYLTNVGIDADRLSPVGFGETQPIADNNSDEGLAQNRRVELVVEEGN